jgi:hypothetical protein
VTASVRTFCAPLDSALRAMSAGSSVSMLVGLGLLPALKLPSPLTFASTVSAHLEFARSRRGPGTTQLR